MWHCHVQAQNFFGKLPYPKEGGFGARWQCGVAGRPCHPPPPAPICLLHGKHPTSWRADISSRFLDATVRQSFTSTPTNSGTTITVVKAELAPIRKYHKRPVLMVPLLLPECPANNKKITEASCYWPFMRGTKHADQWIHLTNGQ